MTEPLPERSPTARVPLGLLLAGMLLAGFGQVIEGPMSAGAVWTGVLDSARASTRPHAASALNLYFRNGPGLRTLRMPPGTEPVARSLQPGDSLRVILGWGFRQELGTALGMVQNGTVIVDTATVLRSQRQHSLRLTLGGALLGLTGLAGVFRRRRRGPDVPVTPAP